MQISISDEKTKELLTEVIVDLLKNKRDVLYDVVLEALEEVGLANAIAEGRKNDFVSEDEVRALLDGDLK
jgi:vacuolar-type H+-ATPase subunit D/Vma8